MSVNFDPPSSEAYELRPQSVVTATPLTMACWYNPDVVNTEQHLISINDYSGVKLYTLGLGQNTDNSSIQMGTYDAGWAVSVSATTITAGSWYHACGVSAATNSRFVYHNGVEATENTTTKTPGDIDCINVGCQSFSSANQNTFNGLIAEVGIWTAALDADEVSALSWGVSPLLIRPASLVLYLPMVTHQAAPIERIRGDTWAVAGTPDTADNPPKIWMPPVEDLPFPLAGASTDTSIFVPTGPWR